MSDLIDRQEAIDAFDGTKVDETDCTEYDIGYNDGIDFAVSKLSVLPSAQPVIRCKDCKHFGGGTYCHERDGMWDENDFCSYAERKEQDDG